MRRIISKGGLMSIAANLYIDDEVKTNLFIKECSEQCHTSFIGKYFGEELVSDIMEFSNTLQLENSQKETN